MVRFNREYDSTTELKVSHHRKREEKFIEWSQFIYIPEAEGEVCCVSKDGEETGRQGTGGGSHKFPVYNGFLDVVETEKKFPFVWESRVVRGVRRRDLDDLHVSCHFF